MQRRQDFASLWNPNPNAEGFIVDDEDDVDEKKEKPLTAKRTNPQGKIWTAYRFLLFMLFTAPCAIMIEEYYREFGTKKAIIELTYPEPEAEIPGISICNKNIFKKSSLCKYSPEWCHKLTTKDIRERDNERSIREFVEQIPLNLTRDLGIHREELIKGCYIRTADEKIYTNICRDALWVWNKNRVCYVINFQRADQPDLSDAIDPKLVMTLTMNPRENLIEYENGALEFYLHTPYDVPEEKDPKFYPQLGYRYKIRYSKMTDTLAEVSDCTKYWDNENKGRFPEILSSKMCANRCIWRAGKAKFGCVSASQVLFQNTKKCVVEDPLKFASKEVPMNSIVKCRRKCLDDCMKVTYEMKKERERSGWSLSRKQINITISLMPYNVTAYSHRPKVSTFDVFGYVMAAVGMFMGFSFPATVDNVNQALAYILSQRYRMFECWARKKLESKPAIYF